MASKQEEARHREFLKRKVGDQTALGPQKRHRKDSAKFIRILDNQAPSGCQGSIFPRLQRSNAEGQHSGPQSRQPRFPPSDT